MTALQEKEIARRLADVEAPSPPPELLAQLQADIPALVPSLEAAALEGNTTEPLRRRVPGRAWLAAASIAVAVIGGFLALNVTTSLDESPRSLAEKPTASPTDRPTEAMPPQEPEADSMASAAIPTEKIEFEEPTTSEEQAEAPAQVMDQSPALEASLKISSKPSSKADPRATMGKEVGQAESKNQELERRREAPRTDAPVRDQMSDQVIDLETFDDAIEVQGEAPANISIESVGRAGNQRLEKRKRQIPKPTAVATTTASKGASTGGTAEPNDQPYGDVFFQHSGTNPFVDADEDPLSTFGLDVDTGSYGVLRRYLSDGHLPPPEAIRVEEVVNAFDYGDRPPREGDFALYGEGAQTPFADGSRYRLVRFAVQGRVVDPAHRKAATLVFVVDVSGSMNRGDRLGLVKKSLGLLLDELRPEDRVGLVVFGNRGEVLLEPTGDLERIRSALDRITPGGSTNAEEGLVLGYQQVTRFFRNGGINRVILCSDGVANVGRTGADSLLQRVRQEAERGIELTTLGFGMGNYNDQLMERLADQGDGRYAYLDTLTEARRVLVEDLTGTLQTIASQARAQVEFNPEVVERYRLLGYENRNIADDRFRDDTVDAGEIGAGHGVTVLYEVKLARKARQRADLATLHLRYRSVATGEFEEVSRTLKTQEVQGSWSDASAAFRLASLVAEMAEILKKTYWARGASVEDVFRRAQALSPSFSGDERIAELVALAGKAARLGEDERDD